MGAATTTLALTLCLARLVPALRLSVSHGNVTLLDSLGSGLVAASANAISVNGVHLASLRAQVDIEEMRRMESEFQSMLNHHQHLLPERDVELVKRLADMFPEQEIEVLNSTMREMSQFPHFSSVQEVLVELGRALGRARRRLFSINQCLSNPCRHGGLCSPHALGSNSDHRGYTCTCAMGWKGATCSEDMDECESSVAVCSQGNCTNVPGAYACTCPPGYFGVNCHVRRDASHPVCRPGMDGELCGYGSCLEEPGSSSGFTCICHKGWQKPTGHETCVWKVEEDIPDCQPDHFWSRETSSCVAWERCSYRNGGCEEGSRCLKGGCGECTETDGPTQAGDGFVCFPNDQCNFATNCTGAQQECRLGSASPEDGFRDTVAECKCADARYELSGSGDCVPPSGDDGANPAESIKCADNKTCVHGGCYSDPHICQCQPGYMGPSCEIRKSYCASSDPCQPDFQCQDVVGKDYESFRCVCASKSCQEHSLKVEMISISLDDVPYGVTSNYTGYLRALFQLKPFSDGATGVELVVRESGRYTDCDGNYFGVYSQILRAGETAVCSKICDGNVHPNCRSMTVGAGDTVSIVSIHSAYMAVQPVFAIEWRPFSGCSHNIKFSDDDNSFKIIDIAAFKSCKKSYMSVVVELEDGYTAITHIREARFGTSPDCSRHSLAVSASTGTPHRYCGGSLASTRTVIPFQDQFTIDITMRRETDLKDLMVVIHGLSASDGPLCSESDFQVNYDERTEDPYFFKGTFSDTSVCSEQHCEFPFRYNNVTYDSCTRAGDWHTSWCATSTDDKHNYLTWGNCCPDHCPHCCERHCKRSTHISNLRFWRASEQCVLFIGHSGKVAAELMLRQFSCDDGSLHWKAAESSQFMPACDRRIHGPFGDGMFRFSDLGAFFIQAKRKVTIEKLHVGPKCEQVVMAPEGEIFSPNFPRDAEEDTVCRYLVGAEDANKYNGMLVAMKRDSKHDDVKEYLNLWITNSEHDVIILDGSRWVYSTIQESSTIFLDFRAGETAIIVEALKSFSAFHLQYLTIGEEGVKEYRVTDSLFPEHDLDYDYNEYEPESHESRNAANLFSPSIDIHFTQEVSQYSRVRWYVNPVEWRHHITLEVVHYSESDCANNSLTWSAPMFSLDEGHEVRRFGCGSGTPSFVNTRQASAVVELNRPNLTSDTQFEIRVVLHSAESDCGPTQHLTAPEGEITSPGYPGEYGDLEGCFWVITRPLDQQVLITVEFLEIERGYDQLLIEYGADEPLILPPDDWETHYMQTGSILSRGNTVRLHFATDSSVVYRGFKLSYTSVSGTEEGGCGKVYRFPNVHLQKSHRIASGLLPQNCSWTLIAPLGYSVRLTFITFVQGTPSFKLTVENGEGVVRTISELGNEQKKPEIGDRFRIGWQQDSQENASKSMPAHFAADAEIGCFGETKVTLLKRMGKLEAGNLLSLVNCTWLLQSAFEDDRVQLTLLNHVPYNSSGHNGDQYHGDNGHVNLLEPEFSGRFKLVDSFPLRDYTSHQFKSSASQIMMNFEIQKFYDYTTAYSVYESFLDYRDRRRDMFGPDYGSTESPEYNNWMDEVDAHSRGSLTVGYAAVRACERALPIHQEHVAGGDEETDCVFVLENPDKSSMYLTISRVPGSSSETESKRISEYWSGYYVKDLEMVNLNFTTNIGDLFFMSCIIPSDYAVLKLKFEKTAHFEQAKFTVQYRDLSEKEESLKIQEFHQDYGELTSGADTDHFMVEIGLGNSIEITIESVTPEASTINLALSPKLFHNESVHSVAKGSKIRVESNVAYIRRRPDITSPNGLAAGFSASWKPRCSEDPITVSHELEVHVYPGCRVPVRPRVSGVHEWRVAAVAGHTLPSNTYHSWNISRATVRRPVAVGHCVPSLAIQWPSPHPEETSFVCADEALQFSPDWSSQGTASLVFYSSSNAYFDYLKVTLREDDWCGGRLVYSKWTSYALSGYVNLDCTPNVRGSPGTEYIINSDQDIVVRSTRTSFRTEVSDMGRALQVAMEYRDESQYRGWRQLFKTEERLVHVKAGQDTRVGHEFVVVRPANHTSRRPPRVSFHLAGQVEMTETHGLIRLIDDLSSRDTPPKEVDMKMRYIINPTGCNGSVTIVMYYENMRVEMRPELSSSFNTFVIHSFPQVMEVTLRREVGRKSFLGAVYACAESEDGATIEKDVCRKIWDLGSLARRNLIVEHHGPAVDCELVFSHRQPVLMNIIQWPKSNVSYPLHLLRRIGTYDDARALRGNVTLVMHFSQRESEFGVRFGSSGQMEAERRADFRIELSLLQQSRIPVLNTTLEFHLESKFDGRIMQLEQPNKEFNLSIHATTPSEGYVYFNVSTQSYSLQIQPENKSEWTFHHTLDGRGTFPAAVVLVSLVDGPVRVKMQMNSSLETCGGRISDQFTEVTLTPDDIPLDHFCTWTFQSSENIVYTLELLDSALNCDWRGGHSLRVLDGIYPDEGFDHEIMNECSGRGKQQLVSSSSRMTVRYVRRSTNHFQLRVTKPHCGFTFTDRRGQFNITDVTSDCLHLIWAPRGHFIQLNTSSTVGCQFVGQTQSARQPQLHSFPEEDLVMYTSESSELRIVCSTPANHTRRFWYAVSTEECGGRVELGDSPARIHTPNFPGHYLHTVCTWTVLYPMGQPLRVVVTSSGTTDNPGPTIVGYRPSWRPHAAYAYYDICTRKYEDSKVKLQSAFDTTEFGVDLFCDYDYYWTQSQPSREMTWREGRMEIVVSNSHPDVSIPVQIELTPIKEDTESWFMVDMAQYPDGYVIGGGEELLNPTGRSVWLFFNMTQSMLHYEVNRMHLNQSCRVCHFLLGGVRGICDAETGAWDVVAHDKWTAVTFECPADAQVDVEILVSTPLSHMYRGGGDPQSWTASVPTYLWFDTDLYQESVVVDVTSRGPFNVTVLMRWSTSEMQELASHLVVAAAAGGHDSQVTWSDLIYISSDGTGLKIEPETGEKFTVQASMSNPHHNCTLGKEYLKLGDSHTKSFRAAQDCSSYTLTIVQNVPLRMSVGVDGMCVLPGEQGTVGFRPCAVPDMWTSDVASAERFTSITHQVVIFTQSSSQLDVNVTWGYHCVPEMEDEGVLQKVGGSAACNTTWHNSANLTLWLLYNPETWCRPDRRVEGCVHRSAASYAWIEPHGTRYIDGMTPDGMGNGRLLTIKGVHLPCQYDGGNVAAELYESKGTITSPLYPDWFLDQAQCKWILHPPTENATLILNYRMLWGNSVRINGQEVPDRRRRAYTDAPDHGMADGNTGFRQIEPAGEDTTIEYWDDGMNRFQLGFKFVHYQTIEVHFDSFWSQRIPPGVRYKIIFSAPPQPLVFYLNWDEEACSADCFPTTYRDIPTLQRDDPHCKAPNKPGFIPADHPEHPALTEPEIFETIGCTNQDLQFDVTFRVENNPENLPGDYYLYGY